MGEVKHTPGPWKASRYQGRRSGEYNFLIDSGGVSVLAEVFARDAMNTALDSAANARLIAAAPELLEALRWVTSVLNTLGDLPDDMVSPIPWRNLGAEQHIASARAAIAKADGHHNG